MPLPYGRGSACGLRKHFGYEYPEPTSDAFTLGVTPEDDELLDRVGLFGRRESHGDGCANRDKHLHLRWVNAGGEPRVSTVEVGPLVGSVAGPELLPRLPTCPISRLVAGQARAHGRGAWSAGQRTESERGTSGDGSR
jgi:hypothetical protein